MHLRTFIYFVITLCSVNSYKVLVIYSFPVKSLSILGEGIVRNLINAGHEVTYIASAPTKHDYGQKFRQVDVSSVFELLPDMVNITAVMLDEVEINELTELQELAANAAIHVFENENMKKLLHNPNEKFDVVVADLYETELYSALSALYDCPMIWSYSMGAHWHVLRLLGEQTNPAYTADYLSSNVPPLGFQQRLEELWAQIKWSWLKRSHTLPIEESAYDKYFGPLLAKRGRTLPNYQELIYNASLIFANEHPAFSLVPSIPLNFKPVGGYHIETPAKPLPQDLQSLMDNAKHGVIYFSMGSLWKSKDIPKSVTVGLLKMFGDLKQTVIWKYEEELENLPKNVHIMKWAPQSSILAHPNCLMFISHGGLLSITEAVHFGVATVGVPIYFDQFININKAVSKGYAIKVPLSFNLPQDLKIAIQTMTNDPKYIQKAKEISSIYHDRLVPPGKELVHWIEHVVRTHGAPHLRSSSVYATTYQKMFLDLAAVVVIIIIVLYVAATRILCKSSKKSRKEKQN